MKLIDLLVALTVSEDKMYPLIQAYVWTKIGKEVHLLKRVSSWSLRVAGLLF